MHLKRFYHAGKLTLIAILLLGLAGFLAPQTPARAAAGIEIYINDRALTMDQPPTTIDGRTMVPFRVLFEALGGTVDWDQKTKTVTAKRKETTISLQVEDRIAVVNQDKVTLDVAARVINGRTMVPLRFASESLGAQVDYDEEEETISITLKSVEGVYLDERNLEMDVGDSETLTATVFPEAAYNKRVHWRSTNSTVATVTRISATEAIVAAREGGTATIVVETEDGKRTDTCRVEVQPREVEVTGISLSRSSITLSEGESSVTIRADVRPDDATNPMVSWSSEDDSIATVNRSGVTEALITPMEEGETIITAQTEDGGFEALCRVTVEKYAIPVEGISLSRRTLDLDLEDDEYRTLRATLDPRRASNQNMEWRVEKDGQDVEGEYVALEIDSREDGREWMRIIPLQAGEVRVIVTSEDGNYTASCRVTVE